MLEVQQLLKEYDEINAWQIKGDSPTYISVIARPLQPAIPWASSAEALSQDSEDYSARHDKRPKSKERLEVWKQKLQALAKDEQGVDKNLDGLENVWKDKMPNKNLDGLENVWKDKMAIIISLPRTMSCWSMFEQMKGLSKGFQRVCKTEFQSASTRLQEGLCSEVQSEPQMQSTRRLMNASQTIQVEEGIDFQVSRLVEDFASLQNYDSKLAQSIEVFREKREELDRQILEESEEMTKIKLQMWLLNSRLQTVNENLDVKTAARLKYDKTISIMQQTELAYTKLVDALDGQEGIMGG